MQNPSEDTEWNDILRSKGILPPLEALERKILYVNSSYVGDNRVDSTNQTKGEEEDEIDDISDDEEFMKNYRNKRLQEIKSVRSIMEISKNDFIKEVSDASLACKVVVHVYSPSNPSCEEINHLLGMIPPSPSLKVVKITGQECFGNYPDRNYPTLIVYENGDLKYQHVGIKSVNNLEKLVHLLRIDLAEE